MLLTDRVFNVLLIRRNISGVMLRKTRSATFCHGTVATAGLTSGLTSHLAVLRNLEGLDIVVLLRIAVVIDQKERSEASLEDKVTSQQEALTDLKTGKGC